MPDIYDRYIDINQNRTLPTPNKKSVGICKVRPMKHPPTGRYVARELVIPTVIYIEWPSTRGVGTRSHLTGEYLGKCIRVGNLSNKPAVGTVWPSL